MLVSPTPIVSDATEGLIVTADEPALMTPNRLMAEEVIVTTPLVTSEPIF